MRSPSIAPIDTGLVSHGAPLARMHNPARDYRPCGLRAAALISGDSPHSTASPSATGALLILIALIGPPHDRFG